VQIILSCVILMEVFMESCPLNLTGFMHYLPHLNFGDV
jgi:hypothetical protein